MEMYAAAGDQPRLAVDSVYLGGGTPSLLPAGQIAAILEACHRCFTLLPGCEISMEANPGTLEAEKLQAVRSLGVNRISVGAQSFSDQELAAIGRIHQAWQTRESIGLLRAFGFENVSLDLILGLPEQTERQWISSLEQAVALAPSHLSVYMLELDAKVPLYHSVSTGRTRIPHEDQVADWYLLTVDFMQQAGYSQYEISNFARPGCECRHNLKYWLREPVLAFGVSGHSYDGRARFANLPGLESYLSAVEHGRSPVQWRQPSDAGRDLEETIFLGLRLNRGVDWDQVRRTYGTADLEGCEQSLRETAGMGLLEWCGSAVRLTRRGMLLSNEVFEKFIDIARRNPPPECQTP
jgi:oxygen-independent coproporphyrinogen-3 oxidase